MAEKQKYSCFYPQQRVITKYYEKNCDLFALKFFLKAYPEVADPEKLVGEVYGRMDRHIKGLPYIDSNELYNSTYTYDRVRVNQKLVRAHMASIDRETTTVDDIPVKK